MPDERIPHYWLVSRFGKVGPACRAGLYGSTSEGRVPSTGLRA